MPYRLSDAALGDLDLVPANGYAVREIDLGHPSVREVAEDVVNGNGTYDSTRYFGARAVSLVLQAFAVPGRSRFEVVQRLSAYTSPSRRPYLIFDPDGTGAWYRILLRGSDLGSPILKPGYSDTSVGWVGPEGIYEAAEQTTVTILAGAAATPGGVTFSTAFPITFSATGGADPLVVFNPGSEEAHGVYRLWGPATDPSLQNIRTGQQITFKGITLSAEQYIEVDTRTGTMRLNGRAEEPLLQFYDALNSALFRVGPVTSAGPARFRYVPGTYSQGAHADIIFRPAYA